MPTITFYRQVRADGGTRTGVDIDDEPILTLYEPPAGEQDPSLRWYVDLIFEVRRVPQDTGDVVKWLLRQEAAVARVLKAAAKKLEVGIDAEGWPLRETIALSGQSRLTASCSAVRRMSTRQIASHISDVAANWRRYITEISALPVE